MNKNSVFLGVVLVVGLLGCSGSSRWALNPTLSPEQQKISSVSDASKCAFINHDFIEVAAPHRMNYFVTLGTLEAGGDSYKIISTSTEKVSGANLMQVNYEIYKCK